jgi:hypothetical protein
MPVFLPPRRSIHYEPATLTSNKHENDLQQLPGTLSLLSKRFLAYANSDLEYRIWAGGSPCPSSPKVLWGFTPPYEVLGMGGLGVILDGGFEVVIRLGKVGVLL